MLLDIIVVELEEEDVLETVDVMVDVMVDVETLEDDTVETTDVEDDELEVGWDVVDKVVVGEFTGMVVEDVVFIVFESAWT